MKNLIKIATVMPVLLALLLAGCALDDPGDPTATVNPPGLEDAGARYAAIGNSLTAGYMDSGLMQPGQANSYPRLIANQLGLDNTEFSQPWVAFPGIGSTTPSAPDMISGSLHFDGIGGIGVVAETPVREAKAAKRPVFAVDVSMDLGERSDDDIALDTMMRTQTMTAAVLRQHQLHEARWVLRPKVGHATWSDWDLFEELVEAGAKAMRGWLGTEF